MTTQPGSSWAGKAAKNVEDGGLAETSQSNNEDPLQPNESVANTGSNGAEPVSWFQRLFTRKRNGNSIRENLADALSDDQDSADGFSPEERSMLTSILRLQDVRVEDLMTPRADIVAVSQDIKLAELLKLFETSGHSRMPVYGETLDDPRGMVHIRDVLAYITQKAAIGKSESGRRGQKSNPNLDLKNVSLSKPLSALKLIRNILFVPPSTPAPELMARMQADRMQIALVIDEYGGTDGLVSLEDIVEEIVGDIEDEHDDDEVLIEDKGEGVFVCDAKAELDDIRELLGKSFSFGEHEEDVETIGGLVFDLIGRVPVRGEVITSHGYEFRVLEADPRRIKKIELVPSSRRRARKS